MSEPTPQRDTHHAPLAGADSPEPLLTTGEVARAFSVDPTTVARWGAQGYLTTLRTLGGHRRYYAREVRRYLTEEGR